MNTHWHPDFYSGANSCFIQLSAALGHVNDLFPKAVLLWTCCLFQHNGAAGSELSDGSLPSVVVVVVVVSDTCAHASGVANANAMLNITFFIFPFLFS